MIAHLAPRRVAVVTLDNKQRGGFPVDIDTLLAVDMVSGPRNGVTLALRLTNGERVFAGIYTSVSEAGRDCGRLRVLAGLPVWSQTSEKTLLLSGDSTVYRRHGAVAGMALASVVVAAGLWSTGFLKVGPFDFPLFLGHRPMVMAPRP